MKRQYSLVKTECGYLEVSPKPVLEELESHYREKYYQQMSGKYSSEYTESELVYFENQAKLCEATLQKYFDNDRSLLDIGCGEGFFSRFFFGNGWKVTCVDFSIKGIEKKNPQLLGCFEQGDIIQYLNNYSKNKMKYGLLNLDNVLEHVLYPVDLLNSMMRIMTKNTVARIEVPNDFSAFQQLLTNSGCTSETWVSPPEHLSYFNRDGLVNLFKSVGLKVVSLQADYPIEQFLLNENSNYWNDRALGKAAHSTRVTCTNYLIEKNILRFIDYAEAAADLEFGRILTAYVQLA